MLEVTIAGIQTDLDAFLAKGIAVHLEGVGVKVFIDRDPPAAALATSPCSAAVCASVSFRENCSGRTPGQSAYAGAAPEEES
jgi:hypothetical protein